MHGQQGRHLENTQTNEFLSRHERVGFSKSFFVKGAFITEKTYLEVQSDHLMLNNCRMKLCCLFIITVESSQT
jgi:hypothetical protein